MALKITYREGVELSKKIADMLLTHKDYEPTTNVSYGDEPVRRAILFKDILEVIRKEVENT